MKTILTLLSSLFVIVSCSVYTVKVDVDGVNINGGDVKKGACQEYSDSFFGLTGDFPLKIKIGQEESVEYEANDYEVASDGVKKTNVQCEAKTDAEDSTEGSSDGGSTEGSSDGGSTEGSSDGGSTEDSSDGGSTEDSSDSGSTEGKAAPKS